MGIRFRGLITATIATAAVGAVFTLAGYPHGGSGARRPRRRSRRPLAERLLRRPPEARSQPATRRTRRSA